MATFKMSGPPSMTGDAQKDLESLFAYTEQFHSQVKYMFSSIDEENLSESIINAINKTGEK